MTTALSGGTSTLRADAEVVSAPPISLVLGNDVHAQPTQLHFAITDALPDREVRFYYDGATTPFLSTVVNAAGALTSSLTVTNLTLGSHTLTVSDGRSSDTETFVVEALPAPEPEPLKPHVEPPMPVAVNRWVFQAYDFSTLDSVDTYVLPINPSQVERGFGDYTLAAEPTVVSNGRVILWEGAPKPVLWNWTGRLLTEGDVYEMARWGVTGQRVWVTDDLGDRYLMKVVSYEPTRVRDVDRRWHHEYTMVAAVLAGPGVAA